MNYNSRFKMQDLFTNPQMSKVFPQFKNTTQSVYSFAEVEKRVQEYLKGVLNAKLGDDGLIVRGKHAAVLRRVNALQGVIEALFNSMPSVAKNIRKNTSLYLPYSTLNQIGELNTSFKKIAAMKAVLENITYNPNFNSQNTISPSFKRKQDAWKLKVGFKE